MKGILLDTHIWFWYLTGSKRLPARIKRRIDDSIGEIWLSPISTWELAMLARKGRVQIKQEYRRWFEMALTHLPVREAPINNEVALKSREIQLSHKDPADHFLAATTVVYGLTLATVDRRLTRLSWLATV